MEPAVCLHVQQGGIPRIRACSYQTYDELYDYCYRVAGTVALMSVPVMGVDKAYKVRAPARLPALRCTGGRRCTEPNSHAIGELTRRGRPLHPACCRVVGVLAGPPGLTAAPTC